MIITADLAHAPALVWHGLAAAVAMLRDTFWALVLGFALSGVIQAFVPRRSIESRLANHRPPALTRATAWGVASSSCSYAATAMARSLYRRGADFVSTVAFTVASTNLVLELGLVLLVLLGWTFVVAEGVGGLVMVAVVGLLGATVLGRRPVVDAQGDPPIEEVPPASRPWRTEQGWREVAGFTVGDFVMLRRELVAGFFIAGIISVSVPDTVWRVLLFEGHGSATTVENLAVAPLVALASCVCSIGNVPLAAVLWKGGISFAGVLAFLFADLITLPLLFVYRRYYGTQTALRLGALLYVASVAGAAATAGLFSVWGIVPRHVPGTLTPAAISAVPAIALDGVFLVLLGVFVLLKVRGRSATVTGRFGVDPVCGMQVEIAHAAAHRNIGGKRFVFCGPGCADRFDADPSRFAPAVAPDANRR